MDIDFMSLGVPRGPVVVPHGDRGARQRIDDSSKVEVEAKILSVTN